MLACVIVSWILIGVCLRDAWTAERLPTPKEVAEVAKEAARAERKALKAELKAKRRAEKTAKREHKAAERARQKQEYGILLPFGFGIVVGIAIGKLLPRIRKPW